jgi:hypothetical protein
MKKLSTAARSARMAAVSKTGSRLLAAVALAAGIWLACLPLAQAATATPAEMIQRQLPANMTIATASDPQLLDAVCKAVRQHPKEAALIVRTAAARKSLRPDILCAAIRCSHERKSDCTWVLDVLREWIKADPNNANALIESISQCAPDCREALQSLTLGEGNFGNPPANINPPPGSSGGGASQNKCVVCHNGHEIFIPCDTADKHFQQHPGDTLGPCQPTPATNR